MAGLLDPIPGTMSQQERDLRLKLNDFETPTHLLMQKWYEQQQRGVPATPPPGQVGTTTLRNEAGLRQALLRSGMSPAMVEAKVRQHKLDHGLK